MEAGPGPQLARPGVRERDPGQHFLTQCSPGPLPAPHTSATTSEHCTNIQPQLLLGLLVLSLYLNSVYFDVLRRNIFGPMLLSCS